MVKLSRVVFIFATMTISSCSPFSGDSVIASIQSEIEAILNTNSAVEVVSGATKIIQTNPGTPSLNYKVTTTIGQFANQSTYTTVGGYKVQTTVISE